MPKPKELEPEIYTTLTYGIRIANNILSELAGNYVTRLSPESKEAFQRVFAALFDLSASLRK
jgi:hypothetical protein